MNVIVIVCISLIILVSLLIWISIVYNNYQRLKIKITAAESDMNTLIREEFDILNNIGNIISNTFKNEEPFKNLTSLKEKRLSNFELNRNLKEYIAELYKYKEKYSKDFRENDELIKLNEQLEETEEYIKGCQEYYNDTVVKYNKSISMFPNVIIAKITKQEEKKLYDKIEEDCKL